MRFNYTDMNKQSAFCDMEVFEDVFLVTEVDDNPGGSITNSMENLITQIMVDAQSYIQSLGEMWPTVIERYINDGVTTYSKVKYQYVPGSGEGVCPIQVLDWEPMSEEDFEMLIKNKAQAVYGEPDKVWVKLDGEAIATVDGIEARPVDFSMEGEGLVTITYYRTEKSGIEFQNRIFGTKSGSIAAALNLIHEIIDDLGIPVLNLLDLETLRRITMHSFGKDVALETVIENAYDDFERISSDTDTPLLQQFAKFITEIVQDNMEVEAKEENHE